jgi:alpha-mannosidase
MNCSEGNRPEMVLWGIGDHGGGPSHIDLAAMRKIITEHPDIQITHSWPEAYFNSLDQTNIPLLKKSLNPFSSGCYTSQIRLKKKYRQLENDLFLTEKILSSGWCQMPISYPEKDLKKATDCMLFCQFHDALPGTSIERVEKKLIQRIDHSLVNLENLRNKVLFKKSALGEAAEVEEFPVFLLNPHPWPVTRYFELEFQPPEPNFDPSVYKIPELRNLQGQKIPIQSLKADSNLDQDFRKRMLFKQHLEAGELRQLSASLINGEKPHPAGSIDNTYLIEIGNTQLEFDGEKGMLRKLTMDNETLITAPGIGFTVFEDEADAWGMRKNHYDKKLGEFTLMNPDEAARFCGLEVPELSPVRLIEDGPIRKNIQVFYSYGRSVLIVNYHIYLEETRIPTATGSSIASELVEAKNIPLQIDLKLQLFWMESDRMLKLFIPTPPETILEREVMNGKEFIPRDNRESVMQRWISGSSLNQVWALLNSAQYGVSADKNGAYISVVRSPAYSGHPLEKQHHIVRQDRWTPRMDLGEHVFTFRLLAGEKEQFIKHLGVESLLFHQAPPIWIWYPSGSLNAGETDNSGKQNIREENIRKEISPITLSDNTIEMLSCRVDEENNRLIFRLRESKGSDTICKIGGSAIREENIIELHPFEIKTIGLSIESGQVIETDFLD